MKFIVDAHLPRRLVYRFREAGHDALHTLDLPDGNRTTDDAINALAEREKYIVVTKDADFVDSFLIHDTPSKLFLVSTGNISNADLEALFVPRFKAIESAFQTHDFVELGREGLILHE